MWPELAEQWYWNHKMRNVLDWLPKREQPEADPCGRNGICGYPCTVGWRFPRERPESSGASPGFGTYIGPEVLEDTIT